MTASPDPFGPIFQEIFTGRFGPTQEVRRTQHLARASRQFNVDPYAYFGELERSILAMAKIHLGRTLDDGALANLMLAGSVEAALRIMLRSTEHRRRGALLYDDIAPEPPLCKALFDHLPKTGGTTITLSLLRLFPLHVVAPGWNTFHLQDFAGADSRWPILSGHFGREFHHRIADLEDRRKFVVLREPISWLTSLYKYWRWDVPPGHAGYDELRVRKARELDFSGFIHDASTGTWNYQANFLGYSGERTAAEALDFYHVVGVTSDLAGFLASALGQLGVSPPTPVEDIIARVPQNKSSGHVEVTDADRDHIREAWSRDFECYEIAKAQGHRARADGNGQTQASPGDAT